MPTTKENLIAAIKIIEAVPAEVLDLKEYVHPCGTHFCTAGVLAQHAFFVDQLFMPHGTKHEKLAERIANNSLIWGGWPFNRLFAPRESASGSGGIHDAQLLEQHGHMSDKQLALARLHHALREENAND